MDSLNNFFNYLLEKAAKEQVSRSLVGNDGEVTGQIVRSQQKSMNRRKKEEEVSGSENQDANSQNLNNLYIVNRLVEDS